ncbi:MAG TPA: cyclic nucleotide-binding domain-containing protein [Acidimicrobiia bacterium]|nr:cyclic nucleotide-binding domain-containing protein [Acidimicrobiia bacterium]
MRIEHTFTTLSWIPSEAVTGVNKAVFESGVTHYDAPPPDVLYDLEQMALDDRFRFANRLHAWIDVTDGVIRDAGYLDGSVMGATTVRLGKIDLARFAAVEFAELRAEPEVGQTSARFVQTFGGHVALPAPRRVNRPPFVKFEAPTVWTTISVTLHADGRAETELIGASVFPRHWIYDNEGKLTAKAGLADFKEWWRTSFGKHTPWGDSESPALVTAVESALERELSTHIMRGGEKPKIRKLKDGELLVEQGQLGGELYLLLDGVLAVEVDGESLGEVGPGAILGERAIVESGRRTATLRAITKARVAVARAEQIDRDALATLSEGHRREAARDT